MTDNLSILYYSMYAQQTEGLTRMRGLLEDENTDKRNKMMKEMQEENQRLAREKRDREAKWRNDQEKQNQFEIANTNASHIMTENRQTTTSELAPHRYVPYHFKGLRPDQIAEIEATRFQQTRDKKAADEQERMVEQAWAIQHAKNTEMMLNNEMELKSRQEQMVKELKEQHKVDKVAKDQKWPNHYGDLNALPDVTKNIDAERQHRETK